MEMLNCLREPLPMAWESVSDAPTAIIFENHASFSLALDVLRGLATPRYGVVAFGSGHAIAQSLGWLTRIERALVKIDYVGDLDWPGLEMAATAARIAPQVGLPPVHPAAPVYRAMYAAAAELGAAEGWVHHRGRIPEKVDELLAWIPADMRDAIGRLLKSGRRIPEEVLGPRQMRAALASRG
jgi:hypothetical protein